MGKNFVTLVVVAALAAVAYQYTMDKVPQVRAFTQK